MFDACNVSIAKIELANQTQPFGSAQEILAAVTFRIEGLQVPGGTELQLAVIAPHEDALFEASRREFHRVIRLLAETVADWPAG